MATDTARREPEAAVLNIPAWGGEPAYGDSWPTQLQSDLLRAALLCDERGLAAWRRVRPVLTIAEMDSGVQAVLPQLRTNLRALGVDDHLMELFKGVHRHAWARNQLMLAQVMPVVAALEQAGVPTLMLKGAALMVEGRRDAGVREMTDIDVLIPTRAVADACRVLAECGMRPIENIPLWFVTDYWAPSVRHSTNFENAAGGQLDLHWHALRLSRQDHADADFWAAAQPVVLGGVRTRTLCPADELLLVILHGLGWAPTPTYRWALDAALIARGLCGEVDYDRLVDQALRRRVAPALRAGLRYLKDVADVQAPEHVPRALRVIAPLQHRELSAYAKRPSARSAVDRGIYFHGQYLREHLPVGARATLAAQLRAAAQRLGIKRPAHLRDLRPGGRPGPGRPYAELTAPIGTGACSPPAVAWGAPLDFGDPVIAREHCLYGLWLAEGWGSWIAGREARLALTLPGPAASSLLLSIWAGGHLTASRERAEMRVAVCGEELGRLAFDEDRPRVDGEGVVVPAALVEGRSRLELALGTPAPRSPASLGTVEDTRPIGAYLARLALRPARHCRLGEPLGFGADSREDEMLAGGWAGPDPRGRWTYGPLARLLLRPSAAPSELEWSAEPFVPLGAEPIQVEVSANGALLGVVDYEGPTVQTSRLGLPAARAGEDLVLSWRIREPRSPSRLGLSDDLRPLGMFFRSVTVR